MADAEQAMTGLWDRIAQQWFSWDGWILAAYRNRIDYRSFVGPGTEITEALKDEILRKNRQAILRAIHNNTHEKAKKKTILHYIGKTAVYLLALSSGFVLSLMVGAHLNVAGRIAGELVAWSIFSLSFLANLVIFGQSVPQLAEKLGYKDKGKGKNWHFFERAELTIYKISPYETECCSGFYNKKSKGYNDDAQAVEFSVKEKILGVIGLGFVLVCATITAALSVTKAPAAMGAIKSLAFMSAAFNPIGFILAGATFVCFLGLLLNSVIKLLKKENKMKDFWALFYTIEPDDDYKGRKRLTNVLTGVILIGLLALVGFGMYGSSLVEAEDFMVLAHSGRSMAGIVAVAACAMAGKLVFSLTAAVNLLGLGMRACQVFFTKLFNPSPKPHELKIVEDDIRVERPKPYELAAVGVNALCQPAKTTQPPDPIDPADPHGELDPSPFLEGTTMGLFLVWVTGLGATVRSLGAGLERTKPYASGYNHKY